MCKLLTVICGLILITSAGCSRPETKEPAPANKSDANADLKWAKEGAEVFLTAVKDGNYDEAGALMSAELAKRVILSNSIGSAVRDRYVTGWQLSSWSFKSEEIAPEKNEASFKGKLVSLEKGEAEFVLRMVKEKDNGMWRVTSMTPNVKGAHPGIPEE